MGCNPLGVAYAPTRATGNSPMVTPLLSAAVLSSSGGAACPVAASVSLPTWLDTTPRAASTREASDAERAAGLRLREREPLGGSLLRGCGAVFIQRWSVTRRGCGSATTSSPSLSETRRVFRV